MIFPETAGLYARRAEELKAIVAERKSAQAAWEKENPELARELHDFYAGKLPALDFSSIEYKPNVATRTASANVLAYLAERVKIWSFLRPIWQIRIRQRLFEEDRSFCEG